MKKIITTLTLATLAFGSVFADVKFTTNYRTQMAAFSRVFSSSHGNVTTAENVRAKSYLFRQPKGYADAADNFTITASNDIAGVKLDLNPNAATASGLTWKQYNAYIKLGALTVSAGYWADGIMNGAYRITSDSANLQGETFEAYKLGSIHSGALTVRASDITYLGGYKKLESGSADDKHMTGYLQYKGNVGDTVLKATLAATSLDGAKTWDGSNIYSALAAQLDAKMESVDLEFTFKQMLANNTNATRSISLYAKPLMWDSLNATVGGALGFYNGELTEYSADLRLRFVAGPLSITSMNNLSWISDSGTAKYASKDYGKHVGACYLDNSGAVKYANNVNKWSQSAMWNMLALRLNATDKFALMLNLGDIVGFKSGNHVFGEYGVEAFVAPGFQWKPVKGASITAMCRFGFSNLLLDTDKYDSDKYGTTAAVLVPVILRVTL